MYKMIKNKTMAEILAEKIATMDYGQMITHSEISELINMTRKDVRYNNVIAKAKKILQEQHCRYIENVKGKGYRIVEADDVTLHSLKIVKSGCKRIEKGQKVLSFSPTDDMSEEGRQAHRRVCDRMVQVNAAVQGASVELKLLNKKSHPLISKK